MALLAAGPISPGITHADENTANTRGRMAAGYARPTLVYAMAGIAPAPMPWRMRAATSTPIDGARPPMHSPTAKRPRPTR